MKRDTRSLDYRTYAVCTLREGFTAQDSGSGFRYEGLGFRVYPVDPEQISEGLKKKAFFLVAFQEKLVNSRKARVSRFQLAKRPVKAAKATTAYNSSRATQNHVFSEDLFTCLTDPTLTLPKRTATNVCKLRKSDSFKSQESTSSVRTVVSIDETSKLQTPAQTSSPL